MVIHYDTVNTPIGVLLVAVTDVGVLRVGFSHEDHTTILDDLSVRCNMPIQRSTREVTPAVNEISSYFHDRLQQFTVPIDYRWSSPFRTKVWQYLTWIPYGTTSTYYKVAQAINNTHAARAVGSACATNPVPLIVPCHRVLRTDGTLGGFSGGLETKQFLLNHEKHSEYNGEIT